MVDYIKDSTLLYVICFDFNLTINIFVLAIFTSLAIFWYYFLRLFVFETRFLLILIMRFADRLLSLVTFAVNLFINYLALELLHWLFSYLIFLLRSELKAGELVALFHTIKMIHEFSVNLNSTSPSHTNRITLDIRGIGGSRSTCYLGR